MSQAAPKPRVWDRLSPKQKQYAIWAIAGIGFVVLLLPFAQVDDQPVATRRSPQSIENILTGANTRELGLSSVNVELDRQRARISALERENAELKQGRESEAGAVPPELERLQRQITALEERLASSPVPATTEPPLRADAGATYGIGNTDSTSAYPDVPGARHGPPMTPTGASQPEPPPVIRTIEVSIAENPTDGRSDTATAPDDEGLFLPAGAIISGVLINGVDAPTGRAASSDPLPSLIRIKHHAILPNRFKADVREGFVVAACYGDLASERAYCRAETLSFIREDGKAIEVKLDAALIGEDGKVGLRGTLVSKQGSVIAKASLAGFADGVSRAFTSSYTPVISQTGDFQLPTAGNGLASGAAGGASSALDRVARYYLSLADQMVPVVEISAGRRVSLIVTRGQSLALATR